MQTADATTDLPLAGVRVLDLARLVAGGMVATVLGDFGAEVVKVEQPKTGDPLRAWSPQGSQLWWKVYARNKKSVTLNFGDERGRAILLDLARTADVVIESFVPGKLEGFGLGPERLNVVAPGLVIVRASGFGQTGPYRDRPGFGTLVEAMSGFADMTGLPEGPPTLPPLALADMIAALYGATATMIALRHRERGGPGQVIDLSLLEPIVSILGPLAAEYQHFGIVPERIGNRAPNTAPRNTYRTSDDKWVAISASTQAMAERLLRAVGREDLLADPRFATNNARVENVQPLDAAIQAVIGARTLDENLQAFRAQGVTAGPVYDIVQFLADPHVQEREVIVEVPDDDWGTLKMHQPTPRLSATPGRIRHPGPKLGAHNAEIYGELGLDAAALARLAADGIV